MPVRPLATDELLVGQVAPAGGWAYYAWVIDGQTPLAGGTFVMTVTFSADISLYVRGSSATARAEAETRRGAVRCGWQAAAGRVCQVQRHLWRPAAAAQLQHRGSALPNGRGAGQLCIDTVQAWQARLTFRGARRCLHAPVPAPDQPAASSAEHAVRL